MKKKLQKKIIQETVEEVSAYSLDGSLASLSQQIADWTAEHGSNLQLSWCPYGYSQYSDTPGYHLIKSREETDEEFAKRVVEEEIAESTKLARERAEFERLRKQFEGK